MIIPNIWENKKCSKPPTSYAFHKMSSPSPSSPPAEWLQGLVRCDHHVTSTRPQVITRLIGGINHLVQVEYLLSPKHQQNARFVVDKPRDTQSHHRKKSVYVIGLPVLNVKLVCAKAPEQLWPAEAISDRCRPSNTSWTALPLVPSHCHDRPKSWECLWFVSPNWSGSEMHHWNMYRLVMTNIAMENPPYMEVFRGKSSINGPFSMAMLNNQRVNAHGPFLVNFSCAKSVCDWWLINGPADVW